ncbi:MAG: hypothetical protein GY725_22050 [bacterium]|nr:hypothetical protein [bacterium]
MHPSREEAFRVGVRLVIVALVAGLIVLLFNPVAKSAEAEAPAEYETLLLETPAPMTSGERVQRAEKLLQDEKRRRFGRVLAHTVDLGVRAVSQASPTRLLHGARKLVSGLAHWNDRSEPEDRALALLAFEQRFGELPDEDNQPYQQLLRRERAERAERLISAAETALEQGRLWRAAHSARRALSFEGSAERAKELLDLVDMQEEAQSLPLPEVAAAPVHIETWEAPLAAALLTGNFERAEELAVDRPDAELARATARYLSGNRSDALADLSMLGSREDLAGEIAREWLNDPRLNPEIALERELKDYERSRKLGWVGGSALATDGMSFSNAGYDAWRDALSPMNLAVSAPARIFRDWRPDGSDLRNAADAYLQLLPEGSRSAEARGWLETLPADSRDAQRSEIWVDGLLVLPKAETDYLRQLPRPILVSVEALGGIGFHSLGFALGDADALLIAVQAPPKSDEFKLPAAETLALIGELADGLEDRSLESKDGSSVVLDALRRLDVAVHTGIVVSVEPFVFGDDRNNVLALHRAFGMDSENASPVGEHLSEFKLARGRQDLKVSHALADKVECPLEMYCIARARRLDGDVYARFDVDGDIKLGARTSFADASFAFEVRSDGAGASVSLPVTRWLGIDRWIPLRASIGIGLDGISIGTRPVGESSASATR